MENKTMDILECIQKRYSYRGSYKNTSVPREELLKMRKRKNR